MPTPGHCPNCGSFYYSLDDRITHSGNQRCKTCGYSAPTAFFHQDGIPAAKAPPKPAPPPPEYHAPLTGRHFPDPQPPRKYRAWWIDE